MTWLVLSDSGGGGAQAGQGEHITASQEADNRHSDSAAAAAPSVTGASHFQLILLAVINQDSK